MKENGQRKKDSKKNVFDYHSKEYEVGKTEL